MQQPSASSLEQLLLQATALLRQSDIGQSAEARELFARCDGALSEAPAVEISAEDESSLDPECVTVRTTFRRSYEFPEIFDFIVAAELNDGTIVAHLKGYVMEIDLSCLEDYIDAFDYRDSDGCATFKMLERCHENINNETEAFDRLVVLDKIEVDHAYRGQGFALRLMRESRDLLAQPRTVALAQAMPYGETVNREVGSEKLVQYYCSDPDLGFKDVYGAGDGWLTAIWDEPCAKPEDAPLLDCQILEPAA